MLLGIPRRRKEYNIKIDLKEIRQRVWIGFIWLRYGQKVGTCENGKKFSVFLKCGESNWERISFSRSSLHGISIIIVIVIIAFTVQCSVKNEQCLASLLTLNADKLSLVQMQCDSYDPLSTRPITDADTKYRPGFVTVKHVSSCPMLHAPYFLSVWIPLQRTSLNFFKFSSSFFFLASRFCVVSVRPANEVLAPFVWSPRKSTRQAARQLNMHTQSTDH